MIGLPIVGGDPLPESEPLELATAREALLLEALSIITARAQRAASEFCNEQECEIEDAFDNRDLDKKVDDYVQAHLAVSQ